MLDYIQTSYYIHEEKYRLRDFVKEVFPEFYGSMTVEAKNELAYGLYEQDILLRIYKDGTVRVIAG